MVRHQGGLFLQARYGEQVKERTLMKGSSSGLRSPRDSAIVIMGTSASISLPAQL